MSRAFVREIEGAPTTLPDRPISEHRNFVTPEGLTRLDEALSAFEGAYQRAIGKHDAHGAAEAQRELRYWRSRRSNAEIVHRSRQTEIAAFGSTVTLRRDDGRKQTFRIVGEDEADPTLGTVSYVSPLARAVMNGGPGQMVTIAGRAAEILNVH